MTKISEIYHTKSTPVLSFEISPPKKADEIELLYQALDELKPQKLGVDFISVTYGAGGSGNHTMTRDVAQHIQKHLGITALHHLTAVNQTPVSLRDNLVRMQQAGIDNILALRGDLPDKDYVNTNYPYAKDLIGAIKKFSGFNIGAAVDITRYDNHFVAGLQEKMINGTDFLISQFFFENDIYYHMQEVFKTHEIKIPVSAGIMPIISKNQATNMSRMTGTPLPKPVIEMIHKYGNNPADLEKAGIDYALKQIQDLVNHGVFGIHLYTMNRPQVMKSMLPIINQQIVTDHFEK